MEQNSDNGKISSSGRQTGTRVYDVEILEPENGRDTRWRRAASFQGGNFRIISASDGAGCAAMFITFFIFLVLTAQYGLLAGICFIFFHIIGAIAGSFYATRRLIVGLPWNPWPWRAGNWLVSFLLTVWLAS